MDITVVEWQDMCLPAVAVTSWMDGFNKFPNLWPSSAGAEAYEAIQPAWQSTRLLVALIVGAHKLGLTAINGFGVCMCVHFAREAPAE